MKKMKGYKAFNRDLTCRGFQYEIGKKYKCESPIAICTRGFHFCKSIADCYRYYDMDENTRICEVVASGTILKDRKGIKYVTDHIKIVKEIKNPGEKTNLNPSSSGYCNVGDYNSGSLNSGDYNSGDYNSGDYNSRTSNSGDYNSGRRNSGNSNSGDYNSGDSNYGNSNSGNHNSGCFNSGHYNSGHFNSGDYNFGDCNSGCFNTDMNPKIRMFDKESNWTIDDWRKSNARLILSGVPTSFSNFVRECYMTDEEKEDHPEYKTIGGYIKTFNITKADRQAWWDGLPQYAKRIIKALPNFDEKKFCMCIGIDHI